MWRLYSLFHSNGVGLELEIGLQIVVMVEMVPHELSQETLPKKWCCRKSLEMYLRKGKR